MEYYLFTHSVESKVIGVKDGMAQVELVKSRFKNKRNYEEYLSYFMNYDENAYSNITKFPPLEIKLEYIRPRKGAKLTDFICFAPAIIHKYLINKKVQEILNDFKLPPYKLYEAILYLNDTPNFDYKFFYCPSLGMEYVDFQKSIFSTGNERIGNRNEIKINSIDELRKLSAPINRDKITLKSFFDQNLDLFNLLIIHGTIISQKLRDAFLKERVTGIDITNLSEDKFSIT